LSWIRIQDAIEKFKFVLKLSCEPSGAYYYLGLCNYKLVDYNKAMKCAKKIS
jgi:tetratricopeptide (TPR) repeat protein